MIQTVDNYNSLNIEQNQQSKGFSFGEESSKYYFKSTATNSGLNISLSDYQKNKNNTFFSFFKDEEKKASKNEDDLIISIKKIDDTYIAQTGNYIGKFVWDGLEIDIKSRFKTKFLERMLNFANDVFLDDVSISATETKDSLDISKFIIYYMFIQRVEKAFLLGLPKAYRSINHHDMKLKGKIDINRFIKHDIPFRGKISSTSREQREIQEVIDVLHKAVQIIEKNEFSTKNISHIKAHLKQHKSNRYVSNETINKAMMSKALQNPIFSPYKKVLEYAKFIINGDNIAEKKDAKKETFGFLVNVAELFEIYITKLLQKEFSQWSVSSPKIELYKDKFFTRKIIPDIVIQKDNKVLIFDTKYKRMKFEGKNQYGAGDLDRNDFFQINTYMSYYQNSGYKVIAGGLLYPIEEKFNENSCHSKTWFENSDTKFIVDGIDLSNLEEPKEDESIFFHIIKREDEFIKRVKSLLN
jgi:5-methylcytosine-specific restriction endonuclease McrBC regulatory subunit McrC